MQFGTTSSRLAYAEIHEAIKQLRQANAEALERMCDTLLSAEERTFATGEAEALHDMTTDLGSLAIGYDAYDNSRLSFTVARLLYDWSEHATRHRHAHDGSQEDDGHGDRNEEDGNSISALLSLLKNLLKNAGEGNELPCVAMHRGAVAAYQTWAFKLLDQFADSLKAA